MKRFLLPFLLFIISTSIWGQVTFAKTYTDTLSPSLLPIHIEKGNYDDIFLGGVGLQKTIFSHLNSNGDTIWSKKYTCPTCPYNWLWLDNFTKCKDGNFVLMGKNYLASSSHDIFIMKIDTSGNILWSRGITKENFNYSKIVEGSDSSLYFNGETILFKATSGGNILWGKEYQTDSLSGLVITNIESLTDHILITGLIRNWDTSSTDVTDAIIIKADTSGNIIWKKRYNGSILDEFYNVHSKSDGSILAAGRTFAEGAGWMDGLITKIDMNGNIIWLKTYGDTSANQVDNLTELPDGKLLATGFSYLEYSYPSNANLLLIKTDSSGNPLFIKGYGDSLEQRNFNSIITSDTGSITLVTNGGYTRALLYKIDKYGNADCFERNENFIVDTPTFIENTFFPLTLLPLTFSTYTIPAISTYRSVYNQTYCYTLDVEDFHRDVSNILVYPNPSSGQINFSELKGENQIEVFDILGKLIFSTTFKETTASIDLSKNLKGIYLYSITNKINGVQRGKIILQ